MSTVISQTLVQDIGRTIVLVILVGALVYMGVMGLQIPEGLLSLASIVFGFFFRDAVSTVTAYRRGVNDGKSTV